MPKIWDMIPKETKTKVMAYRHYLEREETKGGKTMTRREGNKLVFEQEDLNTVLAYVIKDNQFRHGNEMPETIVVEVPACATGKDRNEQEYAVPVELVRMANEFIPEEETFTPDEETPPALPPGNDGTDEEVEKEKEQRKTGSTLAPTPPPDIIYYCSKCKRKHNPGKRLHKKHLKYSASSAT